MFCSLSQFLTHEFRVSFIKVSTKKLKLYNNTKRDGEGDSFNKSSITLQSYAAPNWATLHPTELSCTLPSYAAPSWATLHFWAKLHPFELRCTLRSHNCCWKGLKRKSSKKNNKHWQSRHFIQGSMCNANQPWSHHALHFSHNCLVIFFRVICLKNEKSIFIHPCHKTKKLSKLGPLFMCSFGTYDTEVHVEVGN